MIEIEVGRLSSGSFYARPKGGLGTCGWHPFPWNITVGRTAEKAKRRFLEVHRKQISELEKSNG